MYVCMYVCMHVCMYVCMYVCMHAICMHAKEVQSSTLRHYQILLMRMRDPTVST